MVHGVCIGGFGICSDTGLRFSSPLPVQDPHTNMRAKLRAVLWAPERHRPGVREVFCTDCSMVYLGVMGRAARWKRHAWFNASSPVSHVDLWVKVLSLCDRYVGELSWLKVPALCGVPRNEEADSLANEGRLDSPLYLLPTVTKVSSIVLDEDDRAVQVQDMLEDQSPCLDTVAGCLNFDSDWDDGHQ